MLIKPWSFPGWSAADISHGRFGCVGGKESRTRYVCGGRLAFSHPPYLRVVFFQGCFPILDFHLIAPSRKPMWRITFLRICTKIFTRGKEEKRKRWCYVESVSYVSRKYISSWFNLGQGSVCFGRIQEFVPLSPFFLKVEGWEDSVNSSIVGSSDDSDPSVISGIQILHVSLCPGSICLASKNWLGTSDFFIYSTLNQRTLFKDFSLFLSLSLIRIKKRVVFLPVVSRN